MLEKENLKNWEQIYEGMITVEPENDTSSVNIQSDLLQSDTVLTSEDTGNNKPYQIHNSYIINPIKSGFLVIDQKRAMERIYYEEFIECVKNQEVLAQKKLFPKPVELSAAQSEILRQIKDNLFVMGLEVEEFGNNSFILHSLPAGIEGNVDEAQILESLLSQFQENLELKLGFEESIAASLASKKALRRGVSLGTGEMQAISIDFSLVKYRLLMHTAINALLLSKSMN